MTSRGERAAGNLFLLVVGTLLLWTWPFAVGIGLADKWGWSKDGGYTLGAVLEVPWLVLMILVLSTKRRR